MHTWLPDAHSKAPVPISSLLSGVLLNVAFFAILRCAHITNIAVGKEFTQSLLLFFGIISVVVASFIIFTQKNYKRLLAYSSIEHMGIMSLGIAFGSLASFGALLHMIFHSLTKSLLFLASGNIFLKYHSTKIHMVRGLLFALPLSGVIFIMGALSIAGIPPFGIFLSKMIIFSHGMAVHPIVLSIAIFSRAFIFVGFLKHLVAMVYSESPENIEKGEFSVWTIIPLVCILIILLFMSVSMPQFLQTVIRRAANLYS